MFGQLSGLLVPSGLLLARLTLSKASTARQATLSLSTVPKAAQFRLQGRHRPHWQTATAILEMEAMGAASAARSLKVLVRASTLSVEGFMRQSGLQRPLMYTSFPAHRYLTTSHPRTQTQRRGEHRLVASLEAILATSTHISKITTSSSTRHSAEGGQDKHGQLAPARLWLLPAMNMLLKPHQHLRTPTG